MLQGKAILAKELRKAKFQYVIAVGSPIRAAALPSHTPAWNSSNELHWTPQNPISLLMDSSKNSTARL